MKVSARLGEAASHILGSLCFIEASSYPKYCPSPCPPPSSLELGDLERRGAGKVQEEGAFLFGQEGGGDDVVDACWDVVNLHVAEATPGKRDRSPFRLCNIAATMTLLYAAFVYLH